MRPYLFVLVLCGCTPKLPVCSPDAVGTDKWSAPCRSADEVDSENVAPDVADLPDPSDVSDDQEKP